MKKIKSHYFIPACLVLFAAHTFAQGYSNKLEVTGNQGAGSKIHVACKEVRLKPSYRFTSGTGKTMRTYINPYAVCKVDYSPSPYTMGNIPPVSTTNEVGTMQAAFDVSHTGAATYTIPIVLPPGTNGLQPNLFLSYNSHSGDGIMGNGWQIGGLSAITRTINTLYYNNKVAPVSLNNNDQFTLDGQMIFPLTGSNGGNNTVYGTEIENFTKITSHGTAGDGPAYFLVETKDGIVMEYGNTFDSRIEANGTNTVFTWLLNKVTDAFGNYYTISYTEIDNGSSKEFYPDFIQYTGNTGAGLTPYNKIKFVYGEREDKQKYHVAGKTIETTRLLVALEIYAEHQLMHKYEINYVDILGSLVSDITEKGKDNKAFNATIFAYDELDTNPVIAIHPSGTFPLSSAPNNLNYAVDFNGDGIDDVLRIFNFSQWTVKNSQNGNTFSGNLPLFDWFMQNKTAVPTDLNGDGLTDFIVARKLNINHLGQVTNYPEYYAMFADPDIGFYHAKTFTISNIALINKPMSKYLLGDFDGDGATDIFIYFYDADIGYMHSFKKNVTYPVLNVDLGDENLAFYTVDFNGDGKHEILYTYALDSRILEFDGSNFVDIGGVKNYPNSYHKIFTGDFNGDGKTDLLTWAQSGWEVAYSLGNGKDFNTVPYPIDGDPTNADYEYLIADFNNDGKSDIMINAYNGSMWGNYTMLLHYGKGYLFHPFELYYTNDNILPYGESHLVGDFNGSGKKSYLMRYSSGDIAEIRTNISETNKKIKYIRNGLGHGLQINYATLPVLKYTNNRYVKENTATFPLQDICPPLFVVGMINNQSADGTSLQTTFNYQGAKIHIQGKGFLGFSKFISRNSTSNHITEYTYTLHTNHHQPILNTRKLFLQNTNNLLNETVYQYQFTTTLALGNNGKRYSFYAKHITETDNVRNLTTTQEITMDNAGNITQQKNITANENTTANYTYTKQCSNLPFNNRLSTAQVTTTRSGEAPYTRTVNYTYNGIACSLSEETTDNGVVTAYSRNMRGNLIYEGVQATGVPLSYMLYTYDLKGRFVTETSNTLGHETKFTYEPAYGNLLSATDPNNLTATYTYDGFGRLLTQTAPTSQQQYTQRVWELNTHPQSIFAIVHSAQGTPQSKVFYDVLGNNIRSEIQGFDGNPIATNRKYNKLGLLIEESEPNSPQLTTFTYENSLLRPHMITYPDGTIQNYVYNNNTSTLFTQAGNLQTFRSQTMDATGKILIAQDNGGSLTYTYHSSGKPKSITSPGNVQTTMQYDAFGRQTQLHDQNAGLMQYEYDALGRLTKQTDAANNITNLSYDVLGRLNDKTYSSGANMAYEYDAPNAKGQLKKITLSPGTNSGFETHTTDFIYDAFSRLSQYAETFDGQTYTYSYTYDNQNRLTQKTYPSGFVVKQAYNTTGYLQQLSNVGNQPVWQCLSLTERLQPELSKLGNNIDVYHSYTPLGILNSKQGSLTQNNQSNILWQQFYNFNSGTGNLSSRSNTVLNLEEQFTYDNLHRLKEVLDANQLVKQETNYQQNNNGNIAWKSDAGTYYYDTNKPHAISELENPVPGQSLLQQNISYTPYQQPLSLSEGNYLLEYSYGPDEQRRISLLSDNQQNLLKKISYVGEYEKIETGGNIYEVHYINTPDGLSAIALKENGNTEQYYYTETDHLGSLLALYDENGQAVFEQSFDAWGRERNPDDWTYTPNPNTKPEWLIRGYTGHEHLNEFTLINMNGRLYDPVLGRMLSPDNYVQDATGTQGYNRYSYALNNPLKYTDPSGEIPVLIPIIAGAIIGAYIGGSAANGNYNPGQWDYSSGRTWAGMGIGAVVGAAGGYGFAVGAPALAGTGFFSHFGASGTVAAYTLAGGITGGAIGYSSGFAGGMLHSRGNWGYSHQSGMTGLQVGAAIGTVLGGAAGFASGYQPPVQELPGIDYSNVYASREMEYYYQSGVGQRDFSSMNDAQRTEHIFKGIQHSNAYGDGTVNMNEIFSNFDPNYTGGYSTGISQGYSSGIQTISAGNRSLQVQLSFSVYVNKRGYYNPNVNFGGGQTVDRTIKGGNWTFMKNSGFQWGVYNPPGSGNFDYFYNWLRY